MHYLGNSFFCSKFKSDLQILAISKNKLHSVSSKTFKYLHNLKVLLIYENRFDKFLSEDVIKTLPLSIYLVEYSAECCREYVTVCMFLNQHTIPCKIKDIPTTALILMQLSIVFLGFILNRVLLVVYLYTDLYQKKPLQVLINTKDVIATVSYTSLSVFALTYFSSSAIFRNILDVFFQIVDSLFLHKLLETKSVQSRQKYNIIFNFFFLISTLSLIGFFLFSKFSSIEKHVSLSIKLRETMLHCVLFCFPNYYTLLFPLSIIVILLTFWNALNLKFIHSLKTQISHMKDLGAKSVEHRKMIKYVCSLSLTTSCIMTILGLLLLTLFFTSSFFISYFVVIILCLHSMNNLLLYVFFK